MPARTDPEIEPTPGDVIDGDGHLGQDRGVAVGDAGDHAANPGSADHSPHGCQRGPALQGGRGVVDKSVEVVVIPDRLEAELIRGAPESVEFGVGECRGELHRNPHDAEPRPEARTEPRSSSASHLGGIVDAAKPGGAPVRRPAHR